MSCACEARRGASHMWAGSSVSGSSSMSLSLLRGSPSTPSRTFTLSGKAAKSAEPPPLPLLLPPSLLLTLELEGDGPAVGAEEAKPVEAKIELVAPSGVELDLEGNWNEGGVRAMGVS